MTILDQLSNMPERLRHAADYLTECRQREELAKQTRNQLVIEAVDGGMPYRAVAKAAGVSQPHVVRILSHQDDYPAATG